ncbi:MAG: PKD domain-containing protein, partial [Thermoplasmata archaeon]
TADFVTIKYDPFGNRLWVANYNGPGNNHDCANALTIDSSGNIYVTGHSRNAMLDWDYATIKYDCRGNELWVGRQNCPGFRDDWGYALALDSSGNLYVTGWGHYGETDWYNWDCVTIRYSGYQPLKNKPPVPNAGPDQTVYMGDEVLFDGSESYDPDTNWEIIPENPFGFTSSCSIKSEDTHSGGLYTSNPKLSQKGDYITSYEWNFGDDSPPSIGVKSTHIYKNQGVYSVVLTVTDSNGAKKSDICIITVLPLINPPIADAGPDQTAYEGDRVQLNASASYDPVGIIETYVWDFDSSDGMWWETGAPSDATGPTPTHIYGDNGVYTVTLTVTNDKGLSDTDTMLVKVNNVAPSVMNIETYVFVNFTLRVAGEKWHNVELYLYEEEVESGYAGVVRYPGSPDYQSATIGNVRCEVTKPITAKVIYTPDDDPINGQINGANPCWINISFDDGNYELLFHIFNVNQPETWIWNLSINQYLLGHEITYVGTATDLGSDDLKFIWNWCDGSPDTVTTYYNNGLRQDPYPSPWGPYPFTAVDVKKHIFTMVGQYSTTLTVIDDDNGIDTDYTTVAFNNIAPIANAGGIYGGNEGAPINFTGNQIDPDTSDSFTYYWDFGDGSSSTQQNPSHIYMDHGTYTVTFIITDNCGGIGMDTCDVYVNAHPIANVGPDQTLFEGDMVQFSGSKSYDPDGRIIIYKWDFNANIDKNDDGDYTNDPDAFGSSAQHIYFFEGEYQVTLTVTDGLSIAKDALTVTVLPKMKPPADVGNDQQENFEESEEVIKTEQTTTIDDYKTMNQDIEEKLEPAVVEEVVLESIPAESDTIIKDNHNDETSVNPEIQPSEDPKKDNKPDFPVVTITVSIGSIILSTLSLSMPLYMKINRKDLLKNRKRKSIYKYISTNPGDNFNGIKQALNLPNGVLTYHLKILERENFITSKRDGGYKRFYLSGKSKINNIKKLNGVQKIIFNTVKDYPGLSQTEIARKTGTTVQVVNYHIKRLQEDGLIKLQMANGHRSQCFIQNCEDLSIT